MPGTTNSLLASAAAASTAGDLILAAYLAMRVPPVVYPTQERLAFVVVLQPGRR